MNVEYKTLARFPGYRFGSDGSVWTNKVRGGSGYWKQGSEWKQMQTCLHTRGYLITKLGFVHRLILEAFAGKCPPGKEACHNDGNKTNNAIENLRWDTRKRNASDRYKHGTIQFGEKCLLAKLSTRAVIEIRRLYRSGKTRRALAQQFGVTASNIWRIVKGKSWQHLLEEVVS